MCLKQQQKVNWNQQQQQIKNIPIKYMQTSGR